MPQDYYGEARVDRVSDEMKLKAIIESNLVEIFNLLYEDSIRIVNTSPLRFLVYTESEWQERKTDVLMQGIDTCFFLINNYYVFNKEYVDSCLHEHMVLYPVKMWLQEMVDNDKETYNRIKEKIIANLEIKKESSKRVR